MRGVASHEERKAVGERTAGDAAIPREGHRNGPPKPCDRLGKRAEHVREPAGLRERQRLGANEED
jgi:hypothetical protein